MKLKDTKINQAGVMRCCLATMGEFIEEVGDDYEVAEGYHVPCQYGSDVAATGMVLYIGVWEPAWFVERQGNDGGELQDQA